MLQYRNVFCRTRGGHTVRNPFTHLSGCSAESAKRNDVELRASTGDQDERYSLNVQVQQAAGGDVTVLASSVCVKQCRLYGSVKEFCYSTATLSQCDLQPEVL